MIDETNKEELKEHVSPEGLSEKIIYTDSFMITQTQGGKFRVYCNEKPTRIKETKGEAKKDMALLMAMMGHMLHDPKGTLDLMFKDMLPPK